MLKQKRTPAASQSRRGPDNRTKSASNYNTVKASKIAAKTWAEQYLEDHAVPVAFAKENHVKLYDARIIFQRIHPLTGEILDASSIRHKEPPLDPKTGKPMKFTRKRGAANVLYYPAHWNWKLAFNDTSTDLYIVESECSALALAMLGLVAIGTGGKDMVFMAGTKKQKLHEDFEQIKLAGRKVYLLFDGDTASNPEVKASVDAAAKLFAEATR
jgi:hypothetical protein